MDLSVRPLAADDFDGFINYWLGLSQAEIERLGVAIDRVPSAAGMRSDLEAMLIAPDDEVRSFVLAWCINGEAIGHSSLKDIVPGDSGSIHLHMWRADLRGKGHGPHLFCLAAVDFYERFKLNRYDIVREIAENYLLTRVWHKTKPESDATDSLSAAHTML